MMSECDRERKGTPVTDMHTHSHFAAEPEHDQRKRAGFKALILLSSLFALSVWAKRFKWAPIMSMYMETARVRR